MESWLSFVPTAPAEIRTRAREFAVRRAYHYTHTHTHCVDLCHLPSPQFQCALQHLETTTSRVTSPCRIYTDGSLQSDGAVGSAVFSPDLEPPDRGWVGQRLSNHSFSTFCELHTILDAVGLACQWEMNSVIVCDSKPALQSLSSVHPMHSIVVLRILSFLSLLHRRDLTIQLSWVPSHFGLRHNKVVDRLAKRPASYHLPLLDVLSHCPAVFP